MFGFKGFKTIAAMAALAAAGTFSGLVTDAQASTIPVYVTANGVTYTLTDTGGNATTHSFALDITGINTSSDTEGGRTGINGFAFSDEPNTVSGSSTGFTYIGGGLNADGCNSKGNFFCFGAGSDPLHTYDPMSISDPNIFVSASEVLINFSITAGSAFDWATWVPHFKIDWVGSKNNYNLVSQQMSPVPLPAAGLLLMGALGGLGLAKRRRRKAA